MSYVPGSDPQRPQKVYLTKGAKIVHLLPYYASPSNVYEPALCGQLPTAWNAWLGTGTQDEHERAEALAICIGCERVKRGKDY